MRGEQLELGRQSVVYTNQDKKTFATSNYFNISGGIGDEGIGANPDYKITFLGEYRVMGFTLSANAQLSALRCITSLVWT